MNENRELVHNVFVKDEWLTKVLQNGDQVLQCGTFLAEEELFMQHNCLLTIKLCLMARLRTVIKRPILLEIPVNQSGFGNKGTSDET